MLSNLVDLDSIALGSLVSRSRALPVVAGLPVILAYSPADAACVEPKWLLEFTNRTCQINRLQ